MVSTEVMYFSIFCLFITGVLVLDLKVIGRSSHSITFREALIWTAVWVSCALMFYFIIMFHGEKIHGINNLEELRNICQRYQSHLVLSNNYAESLDMYRRNMATEFITGYLIEYTLSMDNIFVIMMILSAFMIKEKYYKRVLFWGILGAIVLRCIFIFTGSALISKSILVLIAFGLFLIYSGIKMYIDRNKDDKIEPQHHWLVKYLSVHLPVFPRYVKDHFVVYKSKKAWITPLFIVLILVEFTDLIFAFDSIPAIFAITIDPYVVFFSNIFAIIGLRSLFFLLIRIIFLFRYLKTGVSVLLVFIGIKLVTNQWLHEIGFKTVYSLYFIVAVLSVSILASVLIPKKTEAVNQ
ncbi:MAG: TerC/Alx family metal homeostasis membrane protein [Bacteroidia bacterium]|nr:TerC/Alx family metal homeostasis membrane protein [Bacteroidia bacterium]